MPALYFVPRSAVSPQRVATKRTSDSDWWVFNWSVTKPHPAAGSVATVWSMCAVKSASVRVGPTVGATRRPWTTSKLAMRHCVPWRTYSNSRRSTWPGRPGSVGAARSRAWIPVISSVLTTCPPRAWSAGASAYTVQTGAICAARTAGSRSRGVSQYRLWCGLTAAAPKNQAPPDAAGGDTLDDAPLDRLISQFAGRPLANGPARVGRWLAGHGHDLAAVVGGERCRCPRSGLVRQHAPDDRRQRPVVTGASF